MPPGSDDDGIEDGSEDAKQNGVIDAGETDPRDADSDDGATDGEEVASGTDPLDYTSYPTTNDGDLDDDGSVTIADFLLGMLILSGEMPLTQGHLDRGDVAPLVGGVSVPDGSFTMGDVLQIQRKVLGMVSF